MTNHNFHKFFGTHISIGVCDLFGICHLQFGIFHSIAGSYYGTLIQTFSMKINIRRKKRLARVG